MVGLAVALFFLYYAAFTAREAAGIAYCQQTVEGINCDVSVPPPSPGVLSCFFFFFFPDKGHPERTA